MLYKSFFLAEIPSEQLLDEVVSDIHIDEIARKYLSNWEKLCPHLGLSPPQKAAISKSHIRDYEEQKCKCLYKWKETKGHRATYRALIQAAEAVEDKQLAENVAKMLQPTPSKVTFCKGFLLTV